MWKTYVNYCARVYVSLCVENEIETLVSRQNNNNDNHKIVKTEQKKHLLKSDFRYAFRLFILLRVYICARACDDVWGFTHCRGQRQRYTTSCPHQQHIQAKVGSNTKYILFSVSLQFELLHLWLLHATRFFCAAAFSPTFVLCFILISSLTVCIFLHGMFWFFFLVYSVLGICFARQVAFSKKLFFFIVWNVFCAFYSA